ncbi:MAG TPA: Ppx/GppA phosphatase family protein [Gammaproteobacteria bacterium]|nr:Ppx/GppA phosphatase family protein [Gammaproteobacteria bacterium]
MDQISSQATPQWIDSEPEREAPLAAAIDLGSNSFHLLMARRAGGRLTIDEHLKEVVRLADLDADNAITPAAMERGLQCLQRYAQRLRAAQPVAIRAVGTNALRIATNAADFLAAAEATLGCRVETVSGIEEARLIYLGVCQSLDSGTRRLVADIGGGSTELIVGEGARPLQLESLPVGCVSLTQQFFPDGRLDECALQHAEVAARRELEPVARGYREIGWTEAAGASGTVYAIAAIARSAGWSDGVITPLVLDRLAAALTSAGRLEDLHLAGLSDDQRPVLPGGLAIMRALFAGLGIRRLRLIDGALREGLLHETFARLRDEDVRIDSVRRLAEACRVDMNHAGRVERTAAALWQQTAPAWSLEAPEYGQWLRWAAQLHESGRAIAHSGYHRHGAYIVGHADLAGCSQQDQRSVALLIRAHRRALPLALFDEHPQARRDSVFALALLLRLAVLLHRSRTGLDDSAMRVTADERTLSVEFPPGWLAVRPLIAADLEEEAGYWQAAGWTLEFS